MTKQNDIGEERSEAHLGVTTKRATLALLTFYIVAGLMNGEHLLDQARLMPYGKERDACVALAKPLAQMGRITRLSEPRHWIEDRLADIGWSNR